MALIAALNKDTLQKLDGYIAMKADRDLGPLESTTQCLTRISYHQILGLLR